MTKAARLRARLVHELIDGDVLHDPHWIDAFRAVPRHLFLPRFFLAVTGDRWTAVEQGDEGWLEQACSTAVLVTQLDDDPGRWELARREGPVPGTPTSSSSMPSIMATMLEQLRVADGHRVLEIGTGTGYNAALLCHRLGSGLVSTVDIDPVLAESAKRRLSASGYAPSCAVGDGAEGFPAGVLYDRVLCTCSVSVVPTAWLEQTLPGGLIVTTLNRPLGAGLIRIVAGEGASGQGRVLPHDGRFMPLRAHRATPPVAPEAGEAEWRSTSLPLNVVVEPRSTFEFFAGLALPGVAPLRHEGALMLTHPDGSWTRHQTGEVAQGGPRRLWDVAERAYLEWTSLGKPGRERFGLTIGGPDQVFWLDSPDGRQWPLGG
ncbi:methyltransferase domain-containing protein [Amycolatopsis sp. H20-H5]|uniref:methyltransferase domain-containing protein n=1 Tax=Amycolatopsis sp. H20-H5 TaxID=3046309 RepID=UPI002DB8F393|nr:methyltransferase domain-containing protein [Amycolatopsis sp. H20-H5]MEC3975386.1 methyltransferase domain-containing protein [Amycolatopsis sp. H20-H5]